MENGDRKRVRQKYLRVGIPLSRTLQNIDETSSRLQRMASDNLSRQARISRIAALYRRNIVNSAEYKERKEYGSGYANTREYDSDVYRGLQSASVKRSIQGKGLVAG